MGCGRMPRGIGGGRMRGGHGEDKFAKRQWIRDDARRDWQELMPGVMTRARREWRKADARK